MSAALKIRKRAMLPIDQLETLRGEPDSGIFKVRHRMNPALHPRYLSNLTLGLVNHFNELINHYHPDLEGILAGFGKIFLRRPDGHFLNEEAHIHLDVAADFWVFRPSVGAQLRGVVNKKSMSHVSVLVHGCFNVPCHLPPGIQSSEWCGTKSKIGQIVRFTVTKMDMSQKIPFIQGNLLSNSVDEMKMANQDVLYDNRVADLPPEEFDIVQQTSEYDKIGMDKPKKKRKRVTATSNDMTLPKKKKINMEESLPEGPIENGSLNKKKIMNLGEGEPSKPDNEEFTGSMLEAIKDMERSGQEVKAATKGKKKKKVEHEVRNELKSSFALQLENENVQASKGPDTSKVAKEVGKTSVKKDQASKKPRKVPPYALFMKENRDKLKSELPDLSFSEVAKKMGEMWRGLSQEEKEDYNLKAKDINEQNFLKWNMKSPDNADSISLKKKEEQISAKKRESAFDIFVHEKRVDLNKSYPSLSVADTSRMIEDMWKKCSVDEKDDYIKRVDDASEADFHNMTIATSHIDSTKKKPGKISSYMMFCQEKRPFMVKKFPEKTFGEISQIAGLLWKKLSDHEKKYYKKKADMVYREKVHKWEAENSSFQKSPDSKIVTPKRQNGNSKTGTSSSDHSLLAHKSRG